MNKKLNQKNEQDILNDKLLNATLNGDTALIKQLVKQGADITFADCAMLHVASQSHNIELVQYYLQQGCDINSLGSMAIRYAVCSSNLDMVKYLVENGADILIHDGQLIKDAAGYNKVDIVFYLAQQGLDIHLAKDTANGETKKSIERYIQAKNLSDSLTHSLEENNKSNVKMKI